MEEGPVQYHPHHLPITKTCISDSIRFMTPSDYSSHDNVNHRDQRSRRKPEISEFHSKSQQDKNHLNNKVIVEDNGDEYRIITSVIEPEELEGENGLETGFPFPSANQVTQISEEAKHNSKDEYKTDAMVKKTGLKKYSEEYNEHNYNHPPIKDFITVDKADDMADEFTIITSLESPILGCEDAKEEIDGSKVQLREEHVVDKADDMADEFTIITSLESPILGCEDAKEEIDGSKVQLREEHVGESLHGRISSWRQNQKIVSEAFFFLRDLDILDMHDKLEDNAKVPEKDQSGEGLPVNQKLIRADAIDVLANNNQYEDKMRDIPNTDQNRSVTVDESLSPNSTLSSKSLGSQSSMSETGSTEGLNVNNGVVKRQLKRNKGSKSQEEEDEDEENSSDDDTGVYRESYRKSTWMFVGDAASKRIPSSISEENSGITESGYTSMAGMEGGQLSGTDDVFNKDPSSHLPERFNHRRNDSTTTTVSEAEFRKEYRSLRKCYVQRSDSQQEYHRMSHKFYEQERTFVLRKDGTDTGFGLHILNDNPAVISGINPGSPAAEAGVQTGLIIVSINKVNVLRCSHAEIIQLMQKDGKQMELEVASSNITTVRDLQMPVFTGTLSKLSSSSILKSWKKRFFILRQDNCLYYYKTQQDKDPLGAIPLTGYVISRHGDIRKNCFKAEKYCSKTYHFMADSRETMTRWVGAMNEASKRGKERKDSWLDVTSVNVQLPALDIRQPDCSGWLCKLGRSSRRWIKRYCVLKDACIYFYKTLSSTEARGVAHLHGYTVSFGLVGNKKCSFSLQPPEPEMRTFSFYSENETDRQRWTDAFQKSILKWVKVD